MRKTSNKLKYKVKYCMVNYHDRYDRNYVRKMWTDSRFVPFSKTTTTDPYDDYDYSHYSQKKIRKYIKRWLLKRIGKPIDKVYSEYMLLGWRNDKERKTIWDKVVVNGVHKVSRYRWRYYSGLYVDSDNILRYKKKDY